MLFTKDYDHEMYLSSLQNVQTLSADSWYRAWNALHRNVWNIHSKTTFRTIALHWPSTYRDHVNASRISMNGS